MKLMSKIKYIDLELKDVKNNNTDFSEELKNVQKELDTMLDDEGIRFLAKKVLKVIEMFGTAVTVHEIASELDVSGQFILEAVNYLVHKGLIQKEFSETDLIIKYTRIK